MSVHLCGRRRRGRVRANKLPFNIYILFISNCIGFQDLYPQEDWKLNFVWYEGPLIFDGLCKCTGVYGTQGKFGELLVFCVLRFPDAHVIQTYLSLSGFLALLLLLKVKHSKTEISISKTQLYVLSQAKLLQKKSDWA